MTHTAHLLFQCHQRQLEDENEELRKELSNEKMRVSLMAVGAWQYFFFIFLEVLNHALVTFPPPKFCQRGQSPRNLQVKQLQKLQVEAAQAFTWGLSMRPFGAKLPFPTVDVPDIWIPRNDHFPNSCATQGRFEDLVMF